MVQTPVKSLTLEEFLELPETKPASEYLEGQIIQKPMPQGEHSTLQRDLVMAAEAVLKPNRIARTYPELRCTFGGQAIVPDITVFVWDRIPRRENGRIANVFPLAPDWVIEILSPGQSQTKVTRKILHCLAHGTQMGWLIDPAEQVIFVYFPDRSPVFFDVDSPVVPLPVPPFAQALQLTLGELFSWLME